ncbi:MAG: hypothetical protein K1X92_08965 [Bacteroidia bacterium]|nr:hypothetical protein [Bacteroidia bacterium]
MIIEAIILGVLVKIVCSQPPKRPDVPFTDADEEADRLWAIQKHAAEEERRKKSRK